MPITEILARNATLYGDEVCLVEASPGVAEKHEVTWHEHSLFDTSSGIYSRREITWRQFDQAANRIANLLLARGVGKGQKAAILLTNCLEWLPIYFGILKTGALAVPMNYRYNADEIEYCLKLAEVDVLIFGPEFTQRVEAIVDRIPEVSPLFFVGAGCPSFAENLAELAMLSSTEPPDVVIQDEDFAAIYFSSGTTGFPKAVLHDHAALVSSGIAEQHHHGQAHDDCFLCMPPLYHTGGKMHWLGSFVTGGKAVLLRGIKPEWILRVVSDEGVTIVFLLVPWANDILHAIEAGDIDLKDYKLDQWRLLHIGAQPVPPSLIRNWKRYFPNQAYNTTYGLTESIGPGCLQLGLENTHKVGAIGKAGFGWQTKIIDLAGKPVAPGEVGELAVKGAGVMKGYYNDPQATAAALDDGWLLTGDMARMDEDGFIYLVDRKKDVIISGGENIYPVQIEDFIHHHNDVKDVAVIGLPDQRLGEIAAAVVELKRDRACTEQEIMEFCASLPRYRRPRKIIFDQVPRSATGKLEKRRLRQRYGVENLVKIETEQR